MSEPVTKKSEITDSEQVSQALDRLDRLAIAGGGWSALRRDPEDGRSWELTFPEGHLRGGGAPLLHVVSRREATEKCGAAATGATGSGAKATACEARSNAFSRGVHNVSLAHYLKLLPPRMGPESPPCWVRPGKTEPAR